MPNSFLIVTFISGHPDLVAWLMAGLLGIIGTIIGAYWALISTKLSKLETIDEGLEVRVGDLEIAVGRFEAEMSSSTNCLAKDLTSKLDALQLENAQAHASIINGFSPRLATIETKMESIQRSIPNGEIREAVRLIKQLLERK